jgi:putative two-component system response regulator
MSDFVPAPSSPRLTRSARALDDAAVKRILVVDDEESIRSTLARYLRSAGYEVYTAESGPLALDLLARSRVSCMLCDVRMPDMSGLEIVPKALAIDGDLAIMMLTAVNDAPTATEALAHGAMDYLMKPVELPTLGEAVERVLHKRQLAIEQRNVERLIREEVALRTEELEREKQALRQLTVSVVDSLINAQEAKDPHLRGHSHRVADLAASIADYLELDADVVEDVRLAGRLHDVGMIGIREEVLNKKGALTPEEFEHVKEHVRIGVEILTPLRHIARVLVFIQDHHEHWDGSGYPRGLSGDDIAIGGRILAGADAYDALTSSRAYREPMSPQETIEYLRKYAGTLLDPRVYEALSVIVRRRKSLVFLDEAEVSRR